MLFLCKNYNQILQYLKILSTLELHYRQKRNFGCAYQKFSDISKMTLERKIVRAF